MRYSIPVIVVMWLAVLCAGCPNGPGSGAKTPGSQASTAPVQSLGTVALVRSDLGLGDGEFVRGLDQALGRLAAEKRLSYLPVGELPAPLKLDMGKDDIGLPEAGSGKPGTMTVAEGEALLQQVGECDLLVLSSQLLVQPALDLVAKGALAVQAILVMDDYLIGAGWAGSSVPVYTIGYEVRDVAFMCGVAAARSSVNGMFTMLGSEDDPHAEEFLKAAAAGAKYQTNGAGVAWIVLPSSEEDGVVEPDVYKQALQRISEDYGSGFVPNHYVINLGRATPTIMQALAGERGYLVGAYADYCSVRPPRVVGCMEKRPGVALELLLADLENLDALGGSFSSGLLYYGLTDGVVGFTDFELYGRYNPDAADIKLAVDKVEALIRAGELDYDY